MKKKEMFSKLDLPEKSVVAILGRREDANVNIVGTGILVGRRTVLTAAHVVGSRPPAEHLRVFSQAAGILMVHEDDQLPDRKSEHHGLHFAGDYKTTENHQTKKDMVLIKLRHDHSGLAAPLDPTSPKGDKKAIIIGVGGGNAGLVERRSLEIRDGDESGIFRLVDRDALGRLDSGSPVFLTREGSKTLAGVYIGGQSRKVIALESQKTWLEEERTRIEEGGDEQRESWELVEAWGSKELNLGHGTHLSIPFTVENPADLLVVSINAVGLPDQEYIPTLRLRLFHGDDLISRRDQPSQIQSIRHQRPKDGRLDGPWEVEICKDELDFGYTRIQVAWSLFEKKS